MANTTTTGKEEVAPPLAPAAIVAEEDTVVVVVAAPPPGVIEAEDDDADSSYGTEGASSTASIASSILKYREENGRTYHKYRDGNYLLPNDEAENDRLDMQHHMFSLTFDKKLLVAPIPEGKTLHRALDIGTGTGIWAIDFVDAHPESDVLGIDLSPIQPQFVPVNCRFEVDDAKAPWTYSYNFDLIHIRTLNGSIADWPKLLTQAFEFLAPGGWIQLADNHIPLRSDDGTLTSTSALQKWCNYVVEATASIGRPLDCSDKYVEQLLAAGFADVGTVEYKWPSNAWPKDKDLKVLGTWTHENISPASYGLSVAAFRRLLGWTVEELEVFLIDVKKDFANPKIHAYFPIPVVWGRKPE